MSNGRPRSVTAVAPGKVILFGEHAVNRGQAALAAAVGLHARCRLTVTDGETYRFRGGGEEHEVPREKILILGERVDSYRRVEDYASIQSLASEDFFAPSKYVLAKGLGASLPPSLTLEWESGIPASSGLGSGGAAFTALAAAMAPLLRTPPTPGERAGWAHLGDVIAHGGVASALDTQTSLLGGTIRYTGRGLAEAVPHAPGLSLVIGDTGVKAATSKVNGRVRRWLAEEPVGRLSYFRAIGALGRNALPLLERGDWEELGLLLTLNQLALEKIGVSCPEIDAGIGAALKAGAYGAKLSGSGGGGILIGLVSDETRAAVADALRSEGMQVYTPEIGAAGVRLEPPIPGVEGEA